jgi:AcrR family transcriptional regulator
MSNEKRRYVLRARAESQRQTRARIIEATMELHREVGPAQTTVAEIARRASVQRLTVYHHFPDERDLFGACQAHWLELHPLPDHAPALAVPDPAKRLRAVLRAQYAWYRETQPMAEHIQRDRSIVPELDALMRDTGDARLARLAGAIADGLTPSADAPDHRRAHVRLALDFWTWRRLSCEGLDDDDAAELMTRAIA